MTDQQQLDTLEAKVAEARVQLDYANNAITAIWDEGGNRTHPGLDHARAKARAAVEALDNARDEWRAAWKAMGRPLRQEPRR